MKRPLLTILFLLLTAGYAAATEQTLISEPLEHGGYGAPVVKFSTIANEFAILVGGQGGWIINHKLLIGVGGYGLVTDHRLSRPWRDYYESDKLAMGYGGVFFGYIDNSDRIVHPTMQVLIGGGAISPRHEHDYYESGYHGSHDHDAFFVIEPQMGVEINFTTFMRLEMTLGYRGVNGVEAFGYSNSDIGGPAGSLTFKFGRF
jgi:hypothetical protein